VLGEPAGLAMALSPFDSPQLFTRLRTHWTQRHMPQPTGDRAAFALDSSVGKEASAARNDHLGSNWGSRSIAPDEHCRAVLHQAHW